MVFSSDFTSIGPLVVAESSFSGVTIHPVPLQDRHSKKMVASSGDFFLDLRSILPVPLHFLHTVTLGMMTSYEAHSTLYLHACAGNSMSYYTTEFNARQNY